MVTAVDGKKKVGLAEIKYVLKEKLQNLPRRRVPEIIRLQFSVESAGFEILPWLSAQKSDNKIYWADRDGKQAMGAIGQTDIITGQKGQDIGNLFKTIRARLKNASHEVRYYGGLAFSPQGRQDIYGAFGVYRFILPRFEICWKHMSLFFACNIFATENANRIVEEVEALQWPRPSVYTSEKFKAVSRTDNPDRGQWTKIFKKVTAALKADRYQKLVLARQSIFEVSCEPDAFELLNQLKTLTPQCFHFAFQFQKGRCFLGASPELLFRRRQRDVESEAVAGTRPRGISPQEDKIFSDELLQSSKENQEHRLVVEAIGQALGKHCRVLNTGTRKLIKFSWGQHLVSLFSGTLKSGVDDADLLGDLHPTPAVGSFPTHWVWKLLEEFEPFDRGWYAAPLGWVGTDESEFIVAIRSAFLDGRNVLVYAGAGILPDSTVDGEWNEIENKISPFKQIFN